MGTPDKKGHIDVHPTVTAQFEANYTIVENYEYY